jgi:Predicted periplasmic ligand-binding sensor domain
MEENRNKSIKGIKIRSLNLAMIFVACILYLLLIYATFYASHYFSNLVSATEQFVTCEHNADLVQEYSNYLTEQARLFALTGKPEYLEAYFREILVDRNREAAIDALRSHHANDEAFKHLQDALDNSNELVKQDLLHDAGFGGIRASSDGFSFGSVYRNSRGNSKHGAIVSRPPFKLQGNDR